jgi:hypothetical protein
LPGVEFEIHSGAHLTLSSPFQGPRQRNATAKFQPSFRPDVTLAAG